MRYVDGGDVSSEDEGDDYCPLARDAELKRARRDACADTMSRDDGHGGFSQHSRQ